jgi:hypothetical protein
MALAPAAGDHHDVDTAAAVAQPGLAGGRCWCQVRLDSGAPRVTSDGGSAWMATLCHFADIASSITTRTPVWAHAAADTGGGYAGARGGRPAARMMHADGTRARAQACPAPAPRTRGAAGADSAADATLRRL